MPDNVRMMRNLEIGECLDIDPNPGESLEKAVKRIKLRASKHRALGRSYKVTAGPVAVHVERVEFGQNRKEESWESLLAGESALVYPAFDKQQKRKLQNRIQYLHNSGAGAYWQIQERGRDLYVVCRVDKFGNGLKRSRPESKTKTQKDKWLNKAALSRLSADFSREQARLAGPNTASGRLLNSVAESMDERAKKFDDLAENWRAPAAALADVQFSLTHPLAFRSIELSDRGVAVPAIRHDEKPAEHFEPHRTDGSFARGAIPGSIGTGISLLSGRTAAMKQLKGDFTLRIHG